MAIDNLAKREQRERARNRAAAYDAAHVKLSAQLMTMVMALPEFAEYRGVIESQSVSPR